MGNKKKKKNKKFSPEVVERAKLMQIRKKPTKSAAEMDYTTVRGFCTGFITGIKEANVSNIGAQLAYFFLLSLFPFLIFLLTLMPFLNIPQEQLFVFLNNILPKEIYSLIESIVKNVLNNRNSGLLSIGLIGTLWSASKGINAIVTSLNMSYGIKETRPFYIARGMSLIFTILFIFLFVLAFVLLVFGRTIGEFLFHIIGLEESFLDVWNYMRIIIPPFIIMATLMLLYWLAPNANLYLKNAIPGAIFSTIAWLAISFGFSYYISKFSNFSKTYGSIGGIIILMLWLYIIGIVLVIGGQLNVSVERMKEQLQKKRK